MDANPQAQDLSGDAEEKEIFENILLDHTLRSEYDMVLSAFAQLATLRLNARWALISLIDGTNQYILVEATQSSRLQPDLVYNDGDQGLIFGCKTLARSLGICGYALDILSLSEESRGRPAPSPLIINDVVVDERFRNRPFVANYPSVRFFAAMPITIGSGFYIGTISVMDDRPRRGLSNNEIKFLRDVGPPIIAHLKMNRVSEVQRRSEKMIKGLGVFMEGGTDLYDWWLELGNNQPRQGAPNGFNPEIKKEGELDGHARPAPQRHSNDASSSFPACFNPLGMTPERFDGNVAVADRPLVATPMESTVVVTDATSGSGEATACPSPDSVLGKPPFEAPTEGPAESHPEENFGSLPTSRGQSSRTFSPEVEEGLIPERLKELFSRAGHIIQQSIEIDGTLFLDARPSTRRERTESATPTDMDGHPRSSSSYSTSSRQDPTSNADAYRRPKAEPSTDSPGSGEDPACGILGLSTSENSSLHRGQTSSLLRLTESFLQALLYTYPQGHVFNASKRSTYQNKEKRHSGTSSEQSVMDVLGKIFPGAQSIAFVPLWDANHERFFAGSFMWSLNNSRVLTCSGDLNYLAAFGNSIMAEVARLEVVSTDKAKSDFISSISHELRSPLHGILASAEILHDTTIDMFQHGMIDTIERCGRTLLDTIQHVLDFAKINNFTRKRTARGGPGAAKGRAGWPRSLSGVPNLSVNVDLSLLAEEVVDSVFAGHEFQGSSSLLATDEASGFPPEGLRRSSSRGHRYRRTLARNGKGRIDVILDIGWRSNWMFRTESGALRRVLMNLFGNALKYTDKGWVKVSLQSTEIESPPGQPKKSVIRISVQDTGRGIAPEYLHSDLFSPFTQENPLNPGTGLGLSIVLQIVRSLGGHICITSEQGVGTEVLVSLTMNHALPGDYDNGALMAQQAIQSTKTKTKGLRIGLVSLDVDSGLQDRHTGDEQAGRESSRLLQASIKDAATRWFDMEVTAPSTWTSSPPDILLVMNLDSWLQGAFARDDASRHHSVRGVFTGVPTIVLCSHEELCREYGQRMAPASRSDGHELVHFVSKPCGPHRLAKALEFCVGTTAHSPDAGSPSRAPSETENSPQSLFQQSPDNYLPGMERSPQDSYFASMAQSLKVVDEASAHTTAGSADKIEKKPKLLLVEDNEINLRLLSTFARRGNFVYDTAMNGLEAVQAFEAAETRYDIIIMDITMPIMDGMEATQEIRKLERVAGRQGPPVMIIALTGLGSTANREKAFDSGVDIFLTKPARLKDLRKMMDDWEPKVARGDVGGA